MLPGDGLPSTTPVPAAFLEPRDRLYNPLVSPEYGGPALNTPVQSRLVLIWNAFYEDGAVKVAPEQVPSTVTTLFTAPNVETISLAFDANMNPTIAYMQAGVCNLRWYDSSVNQMVTTTYPGVDSCQVTTDDKRATQVGRDDIVFAYTREGTLYYRLQRDRYTIEYTFFSPVKGKLLRFGMNRKNRLQFEIKQQEL